MAGRGHPRKRLTPEEAEELDRAMEASGGSMAGAARILGRNVATVKKWLHGHKPLMRKWKPERCEGVDEDTQDIFRAPVLSPEEKRYLAAERVDARIEKDVRNLGFDEDDSDFLVQVAKSTVGKFDSVHDLALGGVVNSLGNLMLLRKRLQEEFDKIAENPEAHDIVNSVGAVTYPGHKKLIELSDRITAISKEIRNVNKATEDGYITRAKIEQIKRQREEEEKTGKKFAGFGEPKTMIQNNYYGPPQQKKANPSEVEVVREGMDD